MWWPFRVFNGLGLCKGLFIAPGCQNQADQRKKYNDYIILHLTSLFLSFTDGQILFWEIYAAATASARCASAAAATASARYNRCNDCNRFLSLQQMQRLQPLPLATTEATTAAEATTASDANVSFIAPITCPTAAPPAWRPRGRGGRGEWGKATEAYEGSRWATSPSTLET